MEPANDDADPAHVNAAGFVPPADHLWQLAEIAARGQPKLIAALWSPPPWMKSNGQECCGGSLLPGMEAELAEFYSVYLGFLEDAGYVLDGLSIQNEPEAVPPWDSCYYTPARYAATAEAIAQRLAADGHAVPLNASDNAIASFVPIFLTPLLAKPTAGPRVGAVIFHNYQFEYYQPAEIQESVATLAAQIPRALPLWMTEFSNTTGIGYGSWDEALAQAELIDATLAGGAGMYVMWNLYRPGGPGEALIVIPTAPGTPGYTVTPKYWTFRQYSKWVRPGAVRIDARSADAEVRVSAFRDDAARATVAVLINRAAEGRWALVEGGVLLEAPLLVRSSESEHGVEIAPDSIDRIGPRIVKLPPRSVTTAVWPDAG
jgi:glucosylceramidase